MGQPRARLIAAVNPWRLALADALMLLTWLVVLMGLIAAPYVTRSPTLGDDLTRTTVRLALGYYAVALTLMLLLRPDDWLATGGPGRLARWCWTLGWASFLVHLAMAFHYAHHWSHADAVAHTEEVSGFGAGIWFSHSFTFVWSADVAWWWLRPMRYAARSVWWDRVLHGYMAFIIFNATVVYEHGLIRWAGILLFAELAAVCCVRSFNLFTSIRHGRLLEQTDVLKCGEGSAEYAADNSPDAID